MSAIETRTVRTMCPMNCHPTLCGMQVTVQGNALVDIRGDKENPDSQGFLCVRGQAAHEIIGNPLRLRHPLLRDRRDGELRHASWDEALDRIARGIDAAGRDRVGVWLGHGSIANDFGTFAHAQLALRFANQAGLQGWEGSMVCWGLGGFGIGLTGPMEANTKEDMGANADLILLWGANLASQPNSSRYVSAAKRRGAHIAAIDVRESEACRLAHETFLVKPGTDAALALALMHQIIADGRHDAAFIDAHTIGFDALRAHVAQYSPGWAAGITGIAADRIVAFARRYADTARAIIMLSGSSMYKDANGWQASRAISCLPALTGKLGKPGAGFGPRHAAAAHGGGMSWSVAAQPRPAGAYLPDQMSAIVDSVVDGRLRGLLLFGTNMLSSFSDAGRLERGFATMDLLVVHDLFLTDMARRHANVVLPGTAWLEDVGCKATATHVYLMDRILEPEGEARSMSDVVRALADALKLQDFYPWPAPHGHIDAVLDHPATGHMTVAQLRERGGFAPLHVSHVAHPDHRYPTPSGKVEFFSARAAECGLPALPSYQARADSSYPLELRTGRTLDHFHSFYDHGRALPSLAKLESEPELWISEGDARARGLKSGDAIRVRNDRGQWRARAEVTHKVPPGTVWAHDGWPGFNTLTSSAPSLPDSATRIFPFTVGQAAFDAHVEVEPA